MANAKDVSNALTSKGVGEIVPAKKGGESLATLLQSVNIKTRFQEMLRDKAPGFISSIISVTNNNKLLSLADPMTIISAAAVAASLDLPIIPALGFAHIVPYKDNKTGKVVAQFQMGWRGYVQLAQRTGLYKYMNAGVVYEGQLKSRNVLSGAIELSEDKASDKVIGYFAHFTLLNGFEKTGYITKEDALKHGKRYSKSFATGKWTTDEDAMGVKTIVKGILSKWAPLSADYQTQRAIQMDHAVISDIDAAPQYLDNPESEALPENAETQAEDLPFGK